MHARSTAAIATGGSSMPGAVTPLAATVAGAAVAEDKRRTTGVQGSNSHVNGEVIRLDGVARLQSKQQERRT